MNHPSRVLIIRLVPPLTLASLIQSLRRKWPSAQFYTVTASPEEEEKVAVASDQVLLTAGLSPREILRRVRAYAPDATIIAGSADYGLGRTYLKAALLARLSGAHHRWHWEPGEPPERPGNRGAMAARLQGVLRRRTRPVVMATRALCRPARRRYYQRSPKRGPRLVQIGITDACNYHCLMCAFHNPVIESEHVESHQPRLPYAVFESLVPELARSGTQRLDLTGHGEPLCHPEAMEMIACALRRKLCVTLKTNGSLLTEEKVRRFVDLRLPRLHVSVNAATDETYAKIHPGTPLGQLDTVVSHLRLMAEYSEQMVRPPIGVEISAVITRLNMGELPELVRVAHAARAERLALVIMAPIREQLDLEPRTEDWPAIRDAIRETRRLARESGILVLPQELERMAAGTRTRSIYARIPCYMGHDFAQILATGDVHFCANCMDPMGNINDQPFTSIWRSDGYRRMREDALALPRTGRQPGRCWCFQGCCHVADNVHLHRSLYGDAALKEIA